MQRFSLLMLLCCGCAATHAEHDYRDVVAADLAIATLTDSPAPRPTPRPAPVRCERCKDVGYITHGDGHRTPCPDCRSGSAGDLYSGPIDTLRQVRELIQKGNALADRSKAILDAAERDGKVTIDIRMPKPAPAGSAVVCPDGFCPLPIARVKPPAPASSPTTVYCAPARPRLFFRRR